jgi:hypothetical protein
MAPWQPQPQEEFVPYWTLDPGWDTALQIRNNVTGHDLTVTPALRVADGLEFPLKPVTLAPNQSVSIDLRQAVAQAASKLMEQNELYGSVILRYAAMDAVSYASMT